MYKNYGITHQHTTFQWPQCNYGMAECLIKIIKHRITMLSTTLKHVDCWDEQLTKVMFGYSCGIQASTRFFPFVILIGQTLRLKTDNYLQSTIAVMDDIANVKTIAEQFSKKMKLVANIHENVMCKRNKRKRLPLGRENIFLEIHG